MIKTIKLHLNDKRLRKMKKLYLELLNERVRVWIYELVGTPANFTVVLGMPMNSTVGEKVKTFLK